MKYQITKRECQNRIDKLNNVCDRCGRKIKPLRTVDNSGNPTYWAGCLHGNNKKGAWGHFTQGVKKEVFDLAEKLVCDGEIEYSGSKSENKTKGERLYWFQSQVSGICHRINKMEWMKTNNPRKTKKEFLEDKYF